MRLSNLQTRVTPSSMKFILIFIKIHPLVPELLWGWEHTDMIVLSN